MNDISRLTKGFWDHYDVLATEQKNNDEKVSEDTLFIASAILSVGHKLDATLGELGALINRIF